MNSGAGGPRGPPAPTRVAGEHELPECGRRREAHFAEAQRGADLPDVPADGRDERREATEDPEHGLDVGSRVHVHPVARDEHPLLGVPGVDVHRAEVDRDGVEPQSWVVGKCADVLDAVLDPGLADVAQRRLGDEVGGRADPLLHLPVELHAIVGRAGRGVPAVPPPRRHDLPAASAEHTRGYPGTCHARARPASGRTLDLQVDQQGAAAEPGAVDQRVEPSRCVEHVVPGLLVSSIELDQAVAWLQVSSDDVPALVAQQRRRACADAGRRFRQSYWPST